MDSDTDGHLWQSNWKILVAYVVFIVVVLGTVLLSFAANIFDTSKIGALPDIIWFLIAAVFLLAFILLLARVFRILDTLRENSDKMDRIAALLERNLAVLKQIEKEVRLSDSAKKILSKQADRQSLQEAVFEKLKQKDFNGASEIIEALASTGGYEALGEQLKAEVDKYRRSAEQEQLKQAINQIEKLLDNYQWVQASERIENLIKAHPHSDEAKALRQKLIDRKQQRKKILLQAWNDAVKRGATDRSLEILKELDLYLTPNEALALQESAKDVFKTKLHNLGVQFSLAVSGKHWSRALEIGRQITRDFPNSKMAVEIREKIDLIQQKVEQQAD